MVSLDHCCVWRLRKCSALASSLYVFVEGEPEWMQGIPLRSVQQQARILRVSRQRNEILQQALEATSQGKSHTAVDENQAVFQAWRESGCVTFGKLRDFSVPSCSYLINEITSAGLTALTRFRKSNEMGQ